MDKPCSFGERLKDIRGEMTQEDLAEQSGVNVWTIRGYEQSRRDPHWHTAVQLIKALGATYEQFADCLPSITVKKLREEARKHGK